MKNIVFALTFLVIAIIGTGAVSASDVVGISDNSTGLMGCDNTSISVGGDICFDGSIIACDNYTDSSSVVGDEIAQSLLFHLHVPHLTLSRAAACPAGRPA